VVQGTTYKEDPKLAEIISQDPALHDWPLVVLVDDVAKATASEISFLWTTFTRFEPAADIYAARIQVVRHHLSYELPIVIDARMKPWYPDVVECDQDTESLVDSRWGEYF
jgi:hypothetical protein